MSLLIRTNADLSWPQCGRIRRRWQHSVSPEWRPRTKHHWTWNRVVSEYLHCALDIMLSSQTSRVRHLREAIGAHLHTSLCPWVWGWRPPLAEMVGALWKEGGAGPENHKTKTALVPECQQCIVLCHQLQLSVDSWVLCSILMKGLTQQICSMTTIKIVGSPPPPSS